MEYETAVKILGYFAMLTSAVNFIYGMASSDRDSTINPASTERAPTDSAGDGERKSGSDSRGGSGYL